MNLDPGEIHRVRNIFVNDTLFCKKIFSLPEGTSGRNKMSVADTSSVLDVRRSWAGWQEVADSCCS